MGSFGVRRFAEQQPSAVAIVDGAGRTWTRGELVELIDRLAAGLAAAGLVPGDVLAILAPNSAEFVAAYLAGIERGLYVAPINWHLADIEIRHMLADSRAKALVADARLGRTRLAAVVAGDSERVLVAKGEVPGFESLHDFGAMAPRLRPERELGRLLPFTSATTGAPKAVLRPLLGARAALAKTVAWHESLGIALEGDHVHLCSSMLYHAAPLEGAVIALEMGHSVVLMDGWEPVAFLRAVAERRVTTTFMVPTMFVRLLKLPEAVRATYSVTTLRFVIHGGAPCPSDVKRRMLEWWGPIIWESYGASEAQGVIVSPEEWLARPGTVGKPIAGTRLKILDGDGRELPARSVGTIYLTPHTGDRFEYLGDEAKTAACHRGEFVTVGDRGYVDEDGFLFLAGRDSELIISSGMNIYPAEIEQVLVAHPAVLDCAVTGAAHELCGEVPIAHVQLVPGTSASSALTTTLLRFAANRLAPMKLPRRIVYRTTLPRDANGKLIRRRLGS